VESRFATAALALMLAGCPRSDSAPAGSEPSPIPAPVDLVATDGPSFDGVILSWQPTCGYCSGYALEASLDGVAFERVNQDLIPADASEVSLALDPSTPELQDFWFRLQAWRGAASSPWSEVATYRSGIRPPSISVAYDPLGQPAISWTNRSRVADTLLLERAVSGPTGPGDWSPLPTDFGATSYLDAECPELRWCSYRVRYGKDGIWSREASVASGPMALRQPVDLQAELTAAGVLLSWTNRSTAAAGIAVHCSPCAGGATLPPGASSYLDPGVPPWPSVRYWVEAFERAPAWPTDPGPLPVAGLPPFRIEGATATLDARAAALPWGLVGDPRSRFAYLTSDPESPVVVRADGTTEDRHSLPHAAFVPPGLVLDGAGNPHVVTRTDPDGTGTLLLAHEWHDGTTWHGEDIGPLNVFFAEARFGIDAGGGLHILYLQADGSSLTHGFQSGGTWSWSPVSQLLRGDAFAVAAEGITYVLQGRLIATLPAGGTWTVEEIPPGRPTALTALVTGPGGRIGILGLDTAIGFDQHLLYVERANGTWGAPETVTPLAAGYPAFSWASTPDGTRLHVTATVPDDGPRGGHVELFGHSAGSWTGMRLAPSPAAPELGYGVDGKLWIAGGGGLWEEP
jgi:hypothetical protein